MTDIPRRLALMNCAEGRHTWGRTVVTRSYEKSWSGYRVCTVCKKREEQGG